VFAFDRTIRTNSSAHGQRAVARVWALTIECFGGHGNTICGPAKHPKPPETKRPTR
jgi:hypothetical protein